MIGRSSQGGPDSGGEKGRMVKKREKPEKRGGTEEVLNLLRPAEKVAAPAHRNAADSRGIGG